jgi:DNA-directed RNA polymerase subunit RPC12/RpoP
MRKKEVVKYLKRIWAYRCNACLNNEEGCSCLEDKEDMIMELVYMLNNKKYKCAMCNKEFKKLKKAEKEATRIIENMDEYNILCGKCAYKILKLIAK